MLMRFQCIRSCQADYRVSIKYCQQIDQRCLHLSMATITIGLLGTLATKSVQVVRVSSYGVPHWHSRDDKLLTPSGPEGSSGSNGFGCRDAADVECRLTQ